MAVNRSRSQNNELAEGMTDGKYIKVAPDRSGPVTPSQALERRQIHQSRYFGQLNEASTMVAPDGTVL